MTGSTAMDTTSNTGECGGLNTSACRRMFNGSLVAAIKKYSCVQLVMAWSTVMGRVTKQDGFDAPYRIASAMYCLFGMKKMT